MSTPYKIFKTKTGEAPAVDGVAVSGTSVYYSKMWTGEDATAFSASVSWTGTPTGTFVYQVSNKPNPIETSDADWSTSTEITVVNPAGSASGWTLSSVASPHFRKRLKYTNASGSGVLYGYVTVPRSHQ